YFVPSHLGVLVKEPRLSEVTSLRYVISGGEKLPLGVMREFKGMSRAELIHSYGPTEVTVGATEWPCEAAAERVLIGRPIGNTHAYVLDGRMEPLPLGVAGELYIGGVGVGRGYIGQAALTAERFVPDPFSRKVGARLYRTGDMVKYDGEARLEFMGRVDDQVKLRGYRIELGEIEAVLRRHQQMREAVVVMRDESGEKRLVAYVVSEAGPDELCDFLRQHLPAYMIPAAWVKLEALPLTANGKVDRRALPDPDSQRPKLSSAYIAPRTAIEREIAEVWQEVLGVEGVGADDNFFDLGGHSLHAIRVHGKLCAKFGNELSLVQLFQFPTITALAGLITQKTTDEPLLEKVYERASKQKEAIAQQRQLIEKRRRTHG
ncbi:MAG TPA: non-ribosomal peptide synthetase, partial [Pyrinomonadaceae bacterium]|nr:non-ribosomal peptide synthetase [Pyrinomonadaceae bacterium]